jgi:alpha-amylase/alpha-mannosidase (GH57 family)
MHQPYYKDDAHNTTLMPWVFLHAIKDYYDIPWYSLDFKSIRSTYNLVPSLILQLDSYIQKQANDKLLDIISKPVNILDAKQREFLQTYIFLSNERNMIKPLHRYYELYLKYKAHNDINHLSDDEILDCEVLFLLSWCGNYLRVNDEVVSRLLRKQAYYTHEDKLELLDALFRFLPKIIELYKRLEDQNISQVSTTPYFHPITPILLDMKSAVDARGDVNLPNVDSSFKDFGIQNTKIAIEQYKEIFGKNPSGFWPAEGSVSFDTAKLFIDNDLKWFCTDEEILFKTIKNRDKSNIYKNYKLTTAEGSIDVRFRDHYLSDAIGFEYSNTDPKTAVNNFIKHLKDIYNSNKHSPLVNVILDGENAWEFFPNNAQDFFMLLYRTIEECDWIECVTMDDITKDEDINTQEISHLGSGSWINGNFDIWIGSEQKNKAWQLLDLTKKDYDIHKQTIDEATNRLIIHEFNVALGSDWFWWYGDDHYTILASQFDELFRTHLINIYHYMGITVPSELYTPIVSKDTGHSFHTQPIDFINPKIDGKKSNYFEWLNSGTIETNKEFSVMDSKKNSIEIVRYGYNFDKIFFLLEGNIEELPQDAKLEFTLDGFTFHITLKNEKQNIQQQGVDIKLFRGENDIEIAFDKKSFKEKDIKFGFELISKDKVIQKFPIYDEFHLKIDNLALRNWYV